MLSWLSFLLSNTSTLIGTLCRFSCTFCAVTTMVCSVSALPGGGACCALAAGMAAMTAEASGKPVRTNVRSFFAPSRDSFRRLLRVIVHSPCPELLCCCDERPALLRKTLAQCLLARVEPRLVALPVVHRPAEN